ncbi:MAG: Gfo/Idh/MocA family protein [Rhodospirillales bacterium]
MTAKLKAGVAGYGVVGERRRGFIDARADMKTTAVCDQKFGGEGALDDGVPYFQTYDRLLEQDLDVLFVAMSNDMAAEVTRAGLERGLHVFCEKPPGRTVEEIEAVIKTERAHPELKLRYGFNHRHHDSVREALRIVHSGELGGVVNLRGVYGKSRLITFGQTSWRTERALAGGGVLLDQGIHMVDLLRLFAGEFSDVHSFVSNAYWEYDVEDNAYALMRAQSGAVAMLHSSATQWRHRFQLDITLEKGALTLSGILSGSKSYGEETLTVLRRGADDMGDPDEEIIRYEHDPSWADEIAGFAESVRTGAPVTDGSSDDVLKTMRLVYQIYCADADWRARWGLSPGADGV